MKRIAITLILSVIVFVATLVVTNIYVSQKSIQIADRNNAVALDNFQSGLNTDILLTEQSARSFLTGITSVFLGRDSSTIIIEESELPEFRARIHENLSQFMKANKYYTGCMFIIDRDICRDFFGRQECYVPCIVHGDSILYDLSEDYDFMNAEHYQHVKSERKPFWTTPSTTSAMAGQLMTLYMPLSLSNGRFFGSFAIALDIKMINEKLKRHLPFGKERSAMFLVDDKGNIFSASHGWILDKEYQNEIRKTNGKLRTDISVSEHQIIRYEGIEYYLYQRNTLLAPWKIYTTCESDAIYENARKINHILFATSLVGMILMLLCSVVISRQIRKNLLLKAAAEEELRMAAKVQTSLLKPTTHNSSLSALQTFMCPAKEAGGDLYDYIEKDGKLTFCIGDVSGKGMPAALFMTQVVSLFRNAVLNSSDPSVIASQINNVLAQNNPDMTFCTFFCGVLSPSPLGESEGASLTYCNAGHNPPVLITHSGSSSYLKVKPNVALGLMEGFPYCSERLQLSAGETLLLYTDGVTEAKNRKRAEYGQQRLLSILSHPTDDIIPTVLNDLHSFVGNYEQTDDITMLSLRPDA